MMMMRLLNIPPILNLFISVMAIRLILSLPVAMVITPPLPLLIVPVLNQNYLEKEKAFCNKIKFTIFLLSK
jgi:hypothetical protein